MKLTIFGASGRTGQLLVEQALAAGHEVTAFVRTPAKLAIKHDRLKVVQGDVADAAQVEKAVSGADAVLSVLGPAKNSPPDMLSGAARNIVAGMQKRGVTRLIALTGAGVADPNDEPKLVNHIIKFMLKLISGRVLKDSEGGVDAIRNSPLEWTVVRVPMLADGPHTGKYLVGYVGKGTGTRIVRADVADFILNQAAESRFVRQSPMISN